jgi:hypothetical protein
MQGKLTNESAHSIGIIRRLFDGIRLYTGWAGASCPNRQTDRNGYG